ncbi:hypothetical protein PG989_011031 [Apiospora arundinis]
MPHLGNLLAILAAVPLFLSPVAAVLPKWDLPDCVDSGQGRWDRVGNVAEFWKASKADKYADDYIKQNVDHSNWTQNLYMELFPKYDHTDMACINHMALCEFKATCDDFNKIKKGSLYYLFVSAKNFHNYIKGLRTSLQAEGFKEALEIDDIRTALTLSEGQAANDPINIPALISASMSMGAGLFAVVPEISGPLGIMSGLVSIIGQTVDSLPKSKELKKVGEISNSNIQEKIMAINDLNLEAIDSIIAAVYGKQGHKQSDIPSTMWRGEVENAAVSVFGQGVWLKDQPTAVLDPMFKGAKSKFAQGLTWQLAKTMKGCVVIIRTDLNTPELCSNPNNGWNAERKECYDLMIWNQKSKSDKHRYFGGANDLNKLWKTFNMSPMHTMKNAVDCWQGSGGKDPGPTGYTTESMVDGIPKCFFAMTVKKGHWYSKDGNYIDLTGDLKGQEKGQHYPPN